MACRVRVRVSVLGSVYPTPAWRVRVRVRGREHDVLHEVGLGDPFAAEQLQVERAVAAELVEDGVDPLLESAHRRRRSLMLPLVLLRLGFGARQPSLEVRKYLLPLALGAEHLGLRLGLGLGLGSGLGSGSGLGLGLGPGLG